DDYPDESGAYEDDWEEDSFENGYVDPLPIGPPPLSSSSSAPARRGKKAPHWKHSLKQLRGTNTGQASSSRDAWPPGREMVYIVAVPATLTGRDLSLEVAYRERKRNGEWTKPKTQRLSHTAIATLPDPADSRVLSLLKGAAQQTSYGYGYYHN